jgi:large subunit ribosomal protein L28
MGRCELTGKGPVVKNLVSHSNIKTKSTAMPNIQKKRVFSQSLGQLVTLRLATSALRDMEHVGGLDKFILGQDESVLSKRALAVRSRISQKLNGGGKAGKTVKAAAPKSTATATAKPAATKSASAKSKTTKK